jgi:vacuolar-type H+-ATPase subunit E/Vma4
MADDGVREDPDEVVAMVGGFIPVTRAGKTRARRTLDEAAARFNPEARAELRAQLGLPPRTRQA